MKEKVESRESSRARSRFRERRGARPSVEVFVVEPPAPASEHVVEDEHVYLPVKLWQRERCLERAFASVEGAEVCWNDVNAPYRALPRPLLDLFQLGPCPRDDGHVCAVLCVPQRELCPDPVRRAGDDDALSRDRCVGGKAKVVVVELGEREDREKDWGGEEEEDGRGDERRHAPFGYP